MALSGVHIVFGYAGPAGKKTDAVGVIGLIKSSQTMTAASPGTTSISAPSNAAESGEPIALVQSSIDIWVAVGSAPDPNANPGTRILCRAYDDTPLYVQAGDKIAWIPA